MGLGTYIVRRILLMIPTILGVIILIFMVTQLIPPGQRAVLYVSSEKGFQKSREDLIREFGLDKPWYIQMVNWLSQVFHGNLGWSEFWHQPVLQGILQRFPYSIELALVAAPPIILLGIYLGVISAVHKDRLPDHLSRVFAIVGWSLPTFWLGIILIAIFYGNFGLFGVGMLSSEARKVFEGASWHTVTGMILVDSLINGRLDIFVDRLAHLVLPVTTLTIVYIAILVRLMRSSMLEVLNKTFVVAARAKGLDLKTVINKHARRNALIPVITVSGLIVAGLMNGVVITETVFDLQGLGRFGAEAAINRDIPAVLGFSLVAALLYVTANLVVDVLYAYLDPRIRLG